MNIEELVLALENVPFDELLAEKAKHEQAAKTLREKREKLNLEARAKFAEVKAISKEILEKEMPLRGINRLISVKGRQTGRGVSMKVNG